MDEKIIKRRTEARIRNRANLDEMWDVIERFVAPFRISLFGGIGGESEVDWRRREIFDSTALSANANLAAHIHGAMTNSEVKWFGFGFRDPKQALINEAKLWLEAADDITYQSFKQSNFDLEASEVYIDLTAFSIGVLTSMPEEDDEGDLKRTQYQALPPSECYFDLAVDDTIINFYRVMQWTADQIVDKFGEEDIPESIKKAYADPSRSLERHKIIFCIYTIPENKKADTFTKLAVENRPYGSKYILWETCELLGKVGGHHEMPVFAPQWRRVSGSQHGFSPAMIAVWDVLTLNQLVELVTVAGEKVIDPTIMTTKKGVYGDIDLSAGGTVVVQDIEKSMKAFESKARFDISSLNKAELQQSIKETFYEDELKLKDSPAMTAAEVYARVQLMQRLIGPTFGRLKTHFMDPVVTRQFMINFRYKKFPDLPEVLTSGNAGLKIEYLGTLAKSQRMESASSIDTWMGNLLAISEVYPEARDIPNVDAVAREQAINAGVPTRLINSPTQVKRTRLARQRKMAQQEEIINLQMEGEAAQSVGKGTQAMREGREGVKK
jgi:hypothetical protein